MDREKVMRGLECCCTHIVGMSCGNCPYEIEQREDEGISDCTSVLAYDALALLKEQEEEIENLKQTCQSMMEGACLMKEQEAVKPVPPEDEFGLYRCGKCYHQLFRCVDKYCSRCGKAVKWDG